METAMKKLFGAAALVVALGSPAVVAAQQAAGAQAQPQPPSAFLALEHREELRLTQAQHAQITAARDSLREAHRIHCAPMHASKPTEAEEARHHEEMAAINARFEVRARAALTPAQITRLAAIQAAKPAAPAEEHGGHHAAPAAGGKPEEHAGHHPVL
jgi:hypothetical protein